MKILYYFFILSLATLSPSTASSNDRNELEALWWILKSDQINHKASDPTLFSNYNKQFCNELLENAMHLDKNKLITQSVFRILFTIHLRKYIIEQANHLPSNCDDIPRNAIQSDWISHPSSKFLMTIKDITKLNIEIHGNYAEIALKFNDNIQLGNVSETKYYPEIKSYFIKQGNKWKVDLKREIEATEKNIAYNQKKSGKSRLSFIAFVYMNAHNQLIPEKLWQPLHQYTASSTKKD